MTTASTRVAGACPPRVPINAAPAGVSSEDFEDTARLAPDRGAAPPALVTVPACRPPGLKGTFPTSASAFVVALLLLPPREDGSDGSGAQAAVDKLAGKGVREPRWWSWRWQTVVADAVADDAVADTAIVRVLARLRCWHSSVAPDIPLLFRSVSRVAIIETRKALYVVLQRLFCPPAIVT